MTKRQYDADEDVEQRRDDALRRALNTPPVQNKDLKGATKKRQDKPTASEKRDQRPRT